MSFAICNKSNHTSDKFDELSSRNSKPSHLLAQTLSRLPALETSLSILADNELINDN